MVAWGHAARIRTRGRRSGLARQVVVGFVDDEDGSVLVAAGDESAAWALNLLSDPACRVTIADRSFEAVAEPLEGAAHAAAVRELILRGGTPAEGLGHGPSFRLRPVDRAVTPGPPRGDARIARSGRLPPLATARFGFDGASGRSVPDCRVRQ